MGSLSGRNGCWPSTGRKPGAHVGLAVDALQGQGGPDLSPAVAHLSVAADLTGQKPRHLDELRHQLIDEQADGAAAHAAQLLWEHEERVV